MGVMVREPQLQEGYSSLMKFIKKKKTPNASFVRSTTGLLQIYDSVIKFWRRSNSRCSFSERSTVNSNVSHS